MVKRREFVLMGLSSQFTLSLPTWAKAKKRTGIVFDEVYLKHTYPGHTEGAHRLKAILALLEQQSMYSSLRSVPARAATMAELQTGHSLNYIEDIQINAQTDRAIYLDEYTKDNYLTPWSWEAMKKASGGVIDLAMRVAQGKLDNGFALVRPPGHHAEESRAMGFCYFNNVALAAKAVQANTSHKRIAIVDFDIHHGNGTQNLTAHDSEILFIDFHQRNLFPMGTGNLHEQGEGDARGTVMNLPVPPMINDDGMKKLFEQTAAKLIDRFVPDMIFVSAGYDGHWKDPLSQQLMTLSGFDWLSRMLVDKASQHCDGRIVFSLEGGYHPEALANGVVNSIYALQDNNTMLDPLGRSLRHDAEEIDGLVKTLSSEFKL